MRKLSLIFIGCFFAILLALVVMLSLAIEESPRVDRVVVLTPEDVARAKRIVDAHRYLVRPGMLAVARIAPADADLAANYLAHRFGKGSARVTVVDHRATINLSLPVALTPLAATNGYLNLKATLAETGSLPRLRSVHIGKLSLPDPLTDIIAFQLEHWLRRSPEYRAGFDALRQVKISRNELAVVYRWTGGFPRFSREVKSSIIGEMERERLLHYQALLAAHTRQNGTTVSLAKILPPLMREAAGRSVTGDVLAENRAVILIASFHVLGISLERILPDAASWPRSMPQQVTVDGRDDFAKHFMVSAAIAAYADTALSDVIGLYKEIEDSRGGSGFSFNDIAADRAGTKFGEKAVASEDSAQALQRRVASGLEDGDLMPIWSDLPEFMPEAEFKQRFGGIDAPAYRAMMQKIEQRVAALGVLH
ncbi:hypothetical protein [Nitrosovibrio tenuis]|uniref:Uncharacterized protein n=1 Tax=Nitrosovibrio tenuis TaxID=1233 RepID=A0A1H7JUN9_9PROT|nr:hypothetical protein [Nitrosovibrio tenuis]SEK78441.1 hypothetical protein SAMN05216387_10313 [Nitrosovibrio tenuis]